MELVWDYWSVTPGLVMWGGKWYMGKERSPRKPLGLGPTKRDGGWDTNDSVARVKNRTNQEFVLGPEELNALVPGTLKRRKKKRKAKRRQGPGENPRWGALCWNSNRSAFERGKKDGYRPLNANRKRGENKTRGKK